MSKSEAKAAESTPKKRAHRFVPLDDVPAPGLSQRAREVLALALCGLAVYGMLCLATFRLADVDQPIPTDGMANLGGAVGYYLALGFTVSLGLAGWVPFVMLLLGSLWLFVGRQFERVTIKVLAAIVFAAMLSILFAGRDGLAVAGDTTPFGTGGNFGKFVSPRLESAFGGTGRLLLVGFGALMSLLIATEWLFSQLVVRTVASLDALWRRVRRRPAAAAAGVGATEADLDDEAESATRRRRRSGGVDVDASVDGGDGAGRGAAKAKGRGRAKDEVDRDGDDESSVAPAAAEADGRDDPSVGRRGRRRRGAAADGDAGAAEANAADAPGGDVGDEPAQDGKRATAADDDGDDEVEPPAGAPVGGQGGRGRRRGGRGAEIAGDGEVDGDAEPTVELPRAEAKSEAAPPSMTPSSVTPSSVTPPSVTPPSVTPPVVIKPRPPKPKPKPKKTGQSDLPFDGYPFPPIELFQEPVLNDASTTSDVLQKGGQAIVNKLASFGIQAEIVEASVGPAVTQFELRLAEGIRVNKVVGFESDLAAALKAVSVRVVAPIPGRDTIGIEVPNAERQKVFMRDLLDQYGRSEELAIPLYLGKDVAGSPIVEDLAKMPHLLIAGTTGSGKSVCINTILLSILMTRTPQQVKLILVDPKMVELQAYKKVPHLCCDVVTNMKKAPGVLQWAVDEMENRYALLSAAGVNHIRNYNRLGQQELAKRLQREPDPERVQLAYVVIVIDEFADLMNVAQNEVEELIQRLAQKSRAVGMHVILATQRPSSEVITGIIKANLPCQIAFKVNRRIDSRVILDANGAEKLLGFGDMLYMPPGGAALLRAQGTFVADDEMHAVVRFLEERGQEPAFTPSLMQTQSSSRPSIADRDERYREAVEIILGQQRGSATLLQRALAVGYTRATRLLELMEEDGLVGAFVGSKSRDVLMTLEEWHTREEAREAAEADAEAGDGAADSGDDGGEVGGAGAGDGEAAPPFALANEAAAGDDGDRGDGDESAAVDDGERTP